MDVLTRPVVLDASIVIRFLDSQHPQHLSAVECLLGVDAPLVINDLTLAEVLVGAFRTGDEMELLRTITDDMSVQVFGESGVAWAMHLARTRATTTPKLTTPDAVVLATAQRVSGQVLSCDTRLQDAAEADNRLYPSSA